MSLIPQTVTGGERHGNATTVVICDTASTGAETHFSHKDWGLLAKV